MRAFRLHQDGRSLDGFAEDTLRPPAGLEGPAVELAGPARRWLQPTLAVVLAYDIHPDALLGEVARALTGWFLAVEFPELADERAAPPRASGGDYLLGEQLLPLELSGELRLYLDGERAATVSVAQFGDPVMQVSRLAARAAGLQGGDTVLLAASSATGVPARCGTLLLEGPLGATLAADLRVAA